jgi:predicted ATPase
VTQLKALGGLRLEPSPFTQPKPLVLLSYLALEGSQHRRHLAELFWSDGNRMKSLSMTLTRLRQGAGEVVEADEKRTWTTLESDAKALLESLDKSHWQQASELYTGAFLEGVVLEDWGSELEEWVYTTREYLAERVQYALLNLAEDAAKKQDFAKAGELAERAYKLPGLGGTASTHLKRLYSLLCAGQSMLAPEVRKEARGYDLTLQLSSEEARATFKQEMKSSSTLPVRGTSFVGRDEELTELATLLSQPNVSLATLLGPAGVGKTRLALQLAHEQQKLGAFKDGVYFVPLDALSDANLIPPSLLNQFGLTQQGKTEPLTQLTDFIADKNILLVLDNFEHLAEGSSLLAMLLSQCPNLKLLVTSREKLRLEEEYMFMLGGLPFATTPTDDATLSDAVQLFGERAQQVQPRFDVDQQLTDVIRICKLVEGLPLGLELAASWVRLMPCRDIASEIERSLELLTSVAKNVPERHHSLKATFEQSWKLLTAKEQEVLRKLSVFVGGFRREAAREVAGATIPMLASLIDKSLLRVLPNGRYDRHPLLYQFTREKLSEKPDEHLTTQEHHARYYLTVAEFAETQLQGKEQVTWFRRLDEELDNLREALGYLETKDDVSEALDLATALGYFWNTRGYYTEGYKYLIAALNKTKGSTFTRAKACLRAGELLWKQGDHISAETLYEQSLAIAKHLGERSLQAKVLIGLGKIAELNQGNFEGARSHFQSALELARESGDKVCWADALLQLGTLSLEGANYQYARTCYETSATLYDELGNQQGRAKSLTNLATVLTYLGELHKAHALNVEGLELFRSIGDRHGMGIALLNLGMDACETGRQQEGTNYYQESLQLFRDLGDKRMVSHLLNNLGGNFQKLAEPDQAQSLLEESLAIQQQIGDVSLIAHARFILGQVHRDKGEFQKAYQTYKECIDLCRKNDDNWTLMRVLEVSAKLHLQQHDYRSAKTELGEAHQLAQAAGDKKTLQKILETRATLDSAVAEGFQSTSH